MCVIATFQAKTYYLIIHYCGNPYLPQGDFRFAPLEPGLLYSSFVAVVALTIQLQQNFLLIKPDK